MLVISRLCHPGGTHLRDNSRMKRNTKAVGDLSEIMVIAELTRAGYSVAVPLGENNRYDIIAEIDGTLVRIQVKTGRLRKGAVIFNCYSSDSHRNGTACRPYTNEVEYFGVYCRELETVYLVGISDTARVTGSLRVHPAHNRQTRGIRWASDYTLKGPRPDATAR
jgi:PD-(D/E)XK endonuclease